MSKGAPMTATSYGTPASSPKQRSGGACANVVSPFHAVRRHASFERSPPYAAKSSVKLSDAALSATSIAQSEAANCYVCNIFFRG